MTTSSPFVQRVVDDPTSKRCPTAMPVRTSGMVIATPAGVTVGHAGAMATKGLAR
jgi:hypothetical protein